MPVENPGMSSCLDLMPSTKLVRSEELREREKSQKASKALAHGAKTQDESKILHLLRNEGPHASAVDIAAKVGMDASTVSKTVGALIDRGHIRRENGLMGDKPRIAAA